MFVIDPVYYQGNKAPLIIRLMHARLRHQNCVLFDTAYQTLIALLLLSKLQTVEPASVESFLNNILPRSTRFIEKAIEKSQSLKFVPSKSDKDEYDFTQGFRLLSEVQSQRRFEWLSTIRIDFEIPAPMIVKNTIQTQQLISSLT